MLHKQSRGDKGPELWRGHWEIGARAKATFTPKSLPAQPGVLCATLRREDLDLCQYLHVLNRYIGSTYIQSKEHDVEYPMVVIAPTHIQWFASSTTQKTAFLQKTRKSVT